MNKEKDCLSFAFGDVVSFKKSCKKGLVPTPTKTGLFVVTSVLVMSGNQLNYAINGCAWYEHQDLALEYRADKMSLELAFSFQEEDGEEL